MVRERTWLVVARVEAWSVQGKPLAIRHIEPRLAVLMGEAVD